MPSRSTPQEDAGAPRRMRCIGGPADGERRLVPAGATTVVVPLMYRGPKGAHMAAVYEVRRRRRGRGVAYPVLVFVRKQPIDTSTGRPGAE